MKTVWRFYADEAGRWRWEESKADKTLLRQSGSSFPCYEECMNDAKRAGYEYEASQPASPRSMSTRSRN